MLAAAQGNLEAGSLDAALAQLAAAESDVGDELACGVVDVRLEDDVRRRRFRRGRIAEHSTEKVRAVGELRRSRAPPDALRRHRRPTCRSLGLRPDDGGIIAVDHAGAFTRCLDLTRRTRP